MTLNSSPQPHCYQARTKEQFFAIVPHVQISRLLASDLAGHKSSMPPTNLGLAHLGNLFRTATPFSRLPTYSFPFKFHKTDTSMVCDHSWSWIDTFWGANNCAKRKSGVMKWTIVTLSHHVRQTSSPLESLHSHITSLYCLFLKRSIPTHFFHHFFHYEVCESWLDQSNGRREWLRREYPLCGLGPIAPNRALCTRLSTLGLYTGGTHLSKMLMPDSSSITGNDTKVRSPSYL